MFFTPNLKRKRGLANKSAVNPFPNGICSKKYEGIFTGISVEVCKREDIAAIYNNGFYGKGSQSRSAPHCIQSGNTEESKIEDQESLCLGLEEADFLAYYLKVLKINDMEGNEIDYGRFHQYCLKVNRFFIETMASYLYLKSKGWVVKSGLKFGGNFLIYHKGPRFYHASFVVIIKTHTDEEHLHSKNFKGLQRIAENSDKDVLVLEVHAPRDLQLLGIKNLSNIDISETVIRRFNCSSYVQNQTAIK